MKIGKRILSIMLMSLLTFSILSVFYGQLIHVSALATGSLTGVIYDSGVDMDSDGTFDYLEVGVEVNVTTPGILTVEVQGLYDSSFNYIGVWGQNTMDLGVGINIIYLSLDGPTIYQSGLNPTNVSEIYLRDENYTFLDFLGNVPLSEQYNYTDFDAPPPPQAFLTGNTYDGGVDTDGDGAFDYLEVGVEVNVTTAGQYDVEVMGLLDSTSSHVWVSGQQTENLNAGTQVVNVSLYGPTIYVSGLNPVNISEITLYSMEFMPPFTYWRDWLDSMWNVPLSREYLYTEFDSPFKDIEASFVVYPDGRVVMGGILNYTHMEPQNLGLYMRGVATLEKSDSMTEMLADFTLIVPPEEASQFPFNSSSFTLLSDYSSGLLTTVINGSTILPNSIASEFPFNATDFTVIGKYVGGMVDGNITIDILNGFPLDDIVMDFQGNNTYVHLNGSTTVIFGNYPSFGELNSTVLEQLLAHITNTIGGTGPGSLYNMTNGLLEFTMLKNETTPLNGGATVDFEAMVEGDLIRTLVNMTGQPASLYDVSNATLSSVENGSFLMTYAHVIREADLNLVFVANVTNLIDNMIPLLADMFSPEEAAFIESILNTTYCTVDAAQFSMDYKNGQVNLTAAATIQDFNAELNYIKSLFLNYSAPQPLTPQLQTINETQMDLTNFGISLNLTDTSMEVNVSGFAVLPPLDWLNATNFKLERFLNITAGDTEPPREGERLKVTVAGGSNATHTVRIIRPGTVPEPDISSPGGMTWNNQSVSELKDLVFQIGPRDNTPPVIDTPVHTPEIPNPSEEVKVSVNVTDADTGVRPDGVILSYRMDGGAWNNITMGKTSGDTYEGTIPGLTAGTQVEYMIFAYDYANNQVIKNNAGNYYVYTVIPEFSTWQIIALMLLLLGVVVVLAKKRKKIADVAKYPLTALMFFAFIAVAFAKKIRYKAS